MSETPSRRPQKGEIPESLKPFMWKKGQSGNPKGRKPGVNMAARIREMLVEETKKGSGKTWAQAIVERLLIEALRGKSAHIKMCLDADVEEAIQQTVRVVLERERGAEMAGKFKPGDRVEYLGTGSVRGVVRCAVGGGEYVVRKDRHKPGEPQDFGAHERKLRLIEAKPEGPAPSPDGETTETPDDGNETSPDGETTETPDDGNETSPDGETTETPDDPETHDTSEADAPSDDAT